MIRKFLSCLLFAGAIAFHLQAQSPKERWIDSVFTRMSIPDKIGQLFMVPVNSFNESGLKSIENKIQYDKAGGILLSPGKTLQQINIINRFQSVSKIPLLAGLNGNSGIASEPDTALIFPSLLAQGALQNDSLVYFTAAEIGRQMKLTGFNINFLPANPLSDKPPFNNESFGENRFHVAAKSLAYWNGLRSQGIMTCAEFFPMHGINAPLIQKGSPPFELSADSVEAFSFNVLMKNELPALLPLSTDLPLFYSDKKTGLKNLFQGSKLSPSFEAKWFQQNFNFSGLLIINIDDMIGSSNKFASGEAEIFAFEAGNDMLITSSNIGPIVRKMKKILRKHKEFLPQLDNSVKKILSLKYDAGLYRKQTIDVQHALTNLVNPEAKLLQQKTHRAAVTVIRNERNILPIQSLEDKKFICVAADDSIKGKAFAKMLSKYVLVSTISFSNKKDSLRLATPLAYQEQVILVALFPQTTTQTLQKILKVLKEEKINREIIICDFGSVISRQYVADFPTIVSAYEDGSEMLKLVPQMIFGGFSAEGKLPIAFGQIPEGTSAKTQVLDRLTYSFPEDAGMDAKSLDKIELIAKEAIDIGATPGCRVLIAKEGKVIYEKSFGYLTYEKQTPVTEETIYDLASVTKVSATLQAVMFMQEKGLIDVNKKASYYLPELKNSNKKDFILKDILTHQAGLWPFLPFWAQTVKDSLYLPEFYNDTLSVNYPYVVSDKLFASASMKDSLWSWIIKAKVREKPQRTPFDYKYSDMGFYILQHLAEKILNQPIEDFLSQNLYEPLGAYTTGYLPLLRFPVLQIAPTENDKLFRRALLVGTVHDQGAAMHGGIAGHAGLFSTANDLAKLGQMLLQEGHYGGLQYYHPETIRLFTQRQFDNSRRGLGWDKPTPGDWNGPTSFQASPKTFGHTGFTGTCIWVDPEFNLVYIFLSNRVHPDMTNNKLLTANIRSRIQEVIYQSIFNYCKANGIKPGINLSNPSEMMGRSHNK